MLPLVSCVMPTFNRFPHEAHLVNEAVESFLRQDYPADRRELIIVNSCAQQKLHINFNPSKDTQYAYGGDSGEVDGSHVVILNLTDRPSLGYQRNVGCEAAKGAILLPWDDDDISLPARISQAVNWLTECNAQYFKPPQVIYLHEGKPPIFEHAVGYRHHASAFTKDAWRAVKSYPDTSGDEDAKMDAKLMARVGCVEGTFGPEEYQYCYRWGVSNRHLSGISDGSAHPHNAHYAEIGRMPVVAGHYTIEPKWRQDYVQLCRDALEGTHAGDDSPAAEGKKRRKGKREHADEQ